MGSSCGAHRETRGRHQEAYFGKPAYVVHGLLLGAQVSVLPRCCPSARSWGPVLEPRKEAVEEAHLSSLVLLKSPSRALDPATPG